MKDMGYQNYEDIIHMPRPVSAVHPAMSMHDRAAQFSPFAALTGYHDIIEEETKLNTGEEEQ